jgi:predicted nucleic acid-binding protein
MRLVVDANVLVAESLRLAGRKLLAHQGLTLVATEQAASETAHELRRRLRSMVDRGRLLADLAPTLLAAAEERINESTSFTEERRYADSLEDARRRIPRDADDAPTIALALALGCGIWTGDRDFFGCGLPVWSTEVLRLHLDHTARVQSANDPVRS